MGVSKSKNLSVETLRGAAIIMVVAGHVIGDGVQYGMRLPDDSFLRHFYNMFVFLRMPLFTVISGWVYALRPASIENLKGFTWKKVRRLLIPMVAVGGSYYLVQYFVPGTNLKNNLADIWKILVFPFTVYWYLPSLFIVFGIVSLLDSFKLLVSFQKWMIFLSIAVFMLVMRTYYIAEADPNYFSYKGAIYLLPFFMLGIGIKRFKEQLSNRYLLILMGVCLATGLIIQQLVWYHVLDVNMTKSSGIGLMIGLTGTVLLLNMQWKARWLVWVGSFAYTIYLFHAFGTAGARIIINRFGIQSTAIIFISSLLTGIFIPVFLEKIFDRYGPTRLVFLGRSYSLKEKGD